MSSQESTNHDRLQTPGHDNPQHTYSNGVLTIGDENVKDEDIITVLGDASSGDSYRILSLVTPTAEPNSEPEAKQQPFQLRTIKAAVLPEEFLAKHWLKALPAHLKPSYASLEILISTKSGTGLALPFFEEVLVPVLAALGLKDSQYDYHKTKNAQTLLLLARQELLGRANEGQKQTLLLLSGDGGVVDIVNGLLDTGSKSNKYIPPTLVQIPLGTGNALFHSLHRPSNISSKYIQALRTLLGGSPKPLPTFKATFSPGARLLTNEAQTASPLADNTLYGAVVASYGLHSTLVADSDTTEYRKHGDKRFGIVAQDLLFPEQGVAHAYKAEVTLLKGGSQEVIGSNEHGYVLASLVSNLEKTFTISPDTKPLDGVLRVVNFGPLSGTESMDIMKAAYQDGKHVQRDEVGYYAVDGMEIKFLEPGESWKWRRVCIDGLIVGIEEGGWVKVQTVSKGSEALEVVGGF